MTRVCTAAVLATVFSMAAQPAHANGRFPASVAVHFDRSGNTILLSATFGLLVSNDGGDSFVWLCEDSIGYGGTFDPDFAVANNGDFFATTFDGLRRSSDAGCTWETVTLGSLSPNAWAEEVTVAANGHVWVTTATTAQANDVFVDRADGLGFVSAGLQTPTGWWKSIQGAPSDSSRVYVTGYQVSGAGDAEPIVHLRRTDNDGGDWIPLPTTSFKLGPEPQLRIATVSAADPALVFAVSDGAGEPIGDLLYRSVDAGVTWKEVLQTSDVITSVVALADGRVLVATIGDGLRISTTSGTAGSFSAVPTPPRAACMAAAPNGELFGCGTNWEPDNFALGRSADGENWTKVVRFQELSGPLSCPSTTPQVQVCAARVWPGICSQFGLCGDVDPVADAGMTVRKNDGCGCSTTAWSALLIPLVGGRRMRRRGFRASSRQ